jgi:predicted enzyme related to lactoylglutathione lyase
MKRKEVTMATVAVQTNPVNWFEIPVRDMGRAKIFYEKVLDRELTLEDMDGLKMAFFPMAQGVVGERPAHLSREKPMNRHMQEPSYISASMISKRHYEG